MLEVGINEESKIMFVISFFLLKIIVDIYEMNWILKKVLFDFYIKFCDFLK